LTISLIVVRRWLEILHFLVEIFYFITEVQYHPWGNLKGDVVRRTISPFYFEYDFILTNRKFCLVVSFF